MSLSRAVYDVFHRVPRMQHETSLLCDLRYPQFLSSKRQAATRQNNSYFPGSS